MTSQIAKAIEEKIAPQGVGVIIEARHLCMQMRGVEKQHGQAVTKRHARRLPPQQTNPRRIFVAHAQ